MLPHILPLLSFSWNVGLRSQFLYGLCLRTQFWFQVNLLAGHEVSLGTAVPYCKCLHMNEKRFPLCTGCQVHNRLPIMSVSRACLTSARPESSFRNLGLSAPTSVNSNDHSRSDLAASSANSSCLPPTFLSTTARRIHRENAEHFEDKLLTDSEFLIASDSTAGLHTGGFRQNHVTSIAMDNSTRIYSQWNSPRPMHTRVGVCHQAVWTNTSAPIIALGRTSQPGPASNV